jgi:hypothetical protein
MSRKPAVDATNEYLGRTDSMEFGVVPDFTAELIDSPVTMEDAELEAFMNEPVMVTVLSGGKDHEAMYVYTSVQGVPQMFKRGMNILHNRHSLRYPFQVNRDDNPRGAAWLRSILAGR